MDMSSMELMGECCGLLGLLLRRTVAAWQRWVLWAPCQARGIGKGRWRVREGDGGTRSRGDCGCC